MVTRADVGLRSERGPILIALMLSTALVALDSTIIATAVPSIVKGIGGFSEFPWLFSIYLLAQAVTVPIYGKLCDVFGRKPVIMLGIGLFLLGSVLCGCAWNMGVLIAFRLVQGLGAGAIQPTAMTVVGDLYSLEERAKVQGYLASVWGVSSVVGPTLGGVFSEYISWRWIFFINIPLCLLAAGMLLRNFHEKVERRPHSVDYSGAAALTVGCAALILGVLEGGQSWSWLSLPGIGVPLVGLALIGAFVLIERRVIEPVLPLWVFSRRLLLTSSLVSASVGAVVLGLTSYIPTYVQDVLGAGPVTAGLALATLTLGWPVAASQAGKLYLRMGFRNCALIGCVPVLVGSLLLLTLGTRSNVWQVGGICFVIGLGMGLVAAPTLIAAQSSVGWSERGVVTGNNLFCRSLGSALGVAVFGAIANATLGTSTGSQLHASGRRLADATNHVFIAVIVVAVGAILAVAAMPKRASNSSPVQPTAATTADRG
jgi:EmrB/QacA subfamily drug resistance transporter